MEGIENNGTRSGLNMSILDFFRVSKIKKERDELAAILDEINGRAVTDVKRKLDELNGEVLASTNQIESNKSMLHALEQSIQEKTGELIVLDEELLLESFALYTPKFQFTTSEGFKDRLDQIRMHQKDLIKKGIAVSANEAWTVNGSKTEGKKMVNDMKKLMLRSFNNECDYCVDNVKFNNIESHLARIEKSYQALNKLGRIVSATIAPIYYQAKVDELRLAYEYQLKKQEEKEEAKRVREELREQQKLEQEIRAAREKILKERRHYQQAIKELNDKLSSKSINDEDRANIEAKLREVTGQMTELDNEEKVIDYREQNAKAGYVYIISNIGSFGPNMFKIGMTRRLEPLERVDELGDASVPFTFDVHALIFSENAPALEAKLHEHFSKSRVNKVNNRKEFFYAELSEIETVVKKHYNNVVDFLHEPPAEQYRESLKL